MAHQRKLIRKAVVALLIAANTAAGARVVGSRIRPHRGSGKLPAISVYTLSDPVNEDKTSNTEEAHELELEIACWVSHSEANPVDDAMDDLAEEVEAAMRANPFLEVVVGEATETLAEEVTFEGTVMGLVEEDGRSDPEIGVAVLTYLVKYKADLTASPPTDLFLRVKSDIQVTGGVEDTPLVSDEFVVQETVGDDEYEET